MKLCTIKEYHLGTKLGQVRSVPVRLGARPENAVLFVYSSQPNLDPWPELFDYPQDTLKMVLYTENGIPMWERDLGPGVIPGVWYAPFISFDLDGDGVDEIWFLNNLNPRLPFSLNARVLERIDPCSGKTTGQWDWPDNTCLCLLYTSLEIYVELDQKESIGGFIHFLRGNGLEISNLQIENNCVSMKEGIAFVTTVKSTQRQNHERMLDILRGAPNLQFVEEL